MARPIIKINWEEFDKLCHFQCTQTEIASWFKCSVDTIQKACLREKKMGYAEYWDQKAEGGRISLRRAQWQTALSGNATMQIWLGKQYLGQDDGDIMRDLRRAAAAQIAAQAMLTLKSNQGDMQSFEELAKPLTIVGSEKKE